MGKKIKDIWIRGTYHNIAFWICLTVSLFLIITAFFIPPMAVIDGSVLGATGELFGFAALGAFIKALDKGVDAKVTKGDIELTVQNPDNNNEEEEEHHHYGNHKKC